MGPESIGSPYMVPFQLHRGPGARRILPGVVRNPVGDVEQLAADRVLPEGVVLQLHHVGQVVAVLNEPVEVGVPAGGVQFHTDIRVGLFEVLDDGAHAGFPGPHGDHGARIGGGRAAGGQRQQCGAESRRRDAAYPPPGSPVTRHTRSFNVLRPCCTIRARVHHVVYGIRLDAEPPPAVCTPNSRRPPTPPISRGPVPQRTTNEAAREAELGQRVAAHDRQQGRAGPRPRPRTGSLFRNQRPKIPSW